MIRETDACSDFRRLIVVIFCCYRVGDFCLNVSSSSLCLICDDLLLTVTTLFQTCV